MQTRPTAPDAPRRRPAAPLHLSGTARPAGALVLALCLLGGVTAPAWATPAPVQQGERVVGTLLRAEAAPAADGPPVHGPDDELAWIEDGSASGVRVDAADVEDVPSGARVEAVVSVAADDGAGPDAAGLAPAREVLAAEIVAARANERSVLAGVPATETAAVVPGGDLAAAITPRRHSVSVVMAVPAGALEGPARLADVVDTVNGPTNDFWSSQTDGAVTFAVTATRDTVDLAASCDEPRALWQQAAAAVGFRGGADQHLLVYVGDEAPGCSAGLGTVGGGVSAGGSAYVADAQLSIVAHELGHNMGLRHSGKLRCPGTVEAASGCETAQYEDRYDVMGVSWGPTGSLNAVQAHRLGALEGDRGADVPPGGARFALSPVGAGAGPRAVRLADSRGATYWVELREPVGRDAFLASRRENHVGLQAGVLVRAEPGDPNEPSLLLDASPSPKQGWNQDFAAALAPGTSMLVAGGRWRITVDGLSGEGAGRRAAVTISPAAPGASTSPDGALTGRPDAAAPPSVPDAPPTPAPGPVPAPPSAAEPFVPAGAVARREGASRYGTAVAVSRASHPGTAPTVVVASGEAFPDALAAGPVAASADGPLLLVPRDGTPEPGVLAELARLAPHDVLLAGGQDAVSDAVAAQLAAVAPVRRVSGGDRFDTAARLAGVTDQRGGTVYLASGATPADAVSGGALAAHDGSVVLLTDRDTLPGATRDALASIAPARVVLLGGVASVGLAVEQEVAAAVLGATVARLGGGDRYDTAGRVALAGYPDGAQTVYLASGDAFADALAGGPAAGADAAPLLLTGRGCVPGPTVDAVKRLKPRKVVVLGGGSAVAEDALRPC